MQKDVQLSDDLFIQDLGTGFSYVNFDRTTEDVTDELTEETRTVIKAASQYRVKNPATYDRIVNTVVQENYPNGADQAALRKGISDSSDPDYIAYNAFVETIKTKCKNEGL